MRPDVEVQTRVGDEKEDEEVGRFLRGEVLADGSETEGFEVDEGGKWLHSWVRSANNGWTAEQVCIYIQTPSYPLPIISKEERKKEKKTD